MMVVGDDARTRFLNGPDHSPEQSVSKRLQLSPRNSSLVLGCLVTHGDDADAYKLTHTAHNGGQY